ncbi:MAG: DUF4357 domain-containing protein [Prevotella sp.]|nr:DUF4357 domain-containing protein [Prevotella sp.]
MNNWNNFVYKLIDCKKKDVSEEAYQQQIEAVLPFLGWEGYKGEINPKVSLHIGNIQPDILIGKKPNWEFVIEIKKPNHEKTNKDCEQLVSYMRQLKLLVGIYIGSDIEIFYDRPNSKNIAKSVYNIEIELDNKKGEKFIELFSKENFSHESLEKFCEARLVEINQQNSLQLIKSRLCNADGEEEIRAFIQDGLINKYKEQFSVEKVVEMLKTIHFNAVPFDDRNSQPKDDDSNPSYIPNLPVSQDKTKLSLDGIKWLNKNRFVLEVLRKYVSLHVNTTFEELQTIFIPKWQGSYGVIRTLKDINYHNYHGKRFFLGPDELLKDINGVVFAVCTQWSKNNIGGIISFVKELGWNVFESTNGEAPKKPTNVGERFFIINKKLHASGIYDGKGFTIEKGSQVDIQTSKSFRKPQERTKKTEKYCKMENGVFTLLEDLYFSSPSGASNFILGRSSDGLTSWQDKNKRTLKDYIDSTQPISE